MRTNRIRTRYTNGTGRAGREQRLLWRLLSGRRGKARLQDYIRTLEDYVSFEEAAAAAEAHAEAGAPSERDGQER